MSQSGQAGRYAGGGGIIQTINGDTGSITGSTVTIYANNVANGAGAYVKFTNSGTVSTLTFTDVLGGNLYLGPGAGTTSGADSLNVGIGINCLPAVNGSTGNTSVGSGSGLRITSGSTNTLLGFAVAQNLTTGSGNILIGGSTTGVLYTSSESYNICMYNTGATGESNVIRIGTHGVGVGVQSSCYIAGIRDVTVSNPKIVTINSSTSQLGVTNGIVGTWTDVTGATQTLAVGNAYATDRGGGVTYTLPATATAGDVIEIWGKAGITTITPNANQQILIGALSGSIGPGGTAVGTNAGDTIILKCLTGGASSVWRGFYNGNWILN